MAVIRVGAIPNELLYSTGRLTIGLEVNGQVKRMDGAAQYW